MTFTYCQRQVIRITALAFAFLLMLGGTADVQAQWSTKWLAVGRMHHPYLSGGAEPENLVEGWQYPGIRPGVAYSHWKGLWVSAKNFTDETGKQYTVRNSHIGPRILGLGEVFDQKHDLVARFEPPVIRVDGFETFNRPVIVDRVDPAIKADRLVDNVINTSIGVTVNRFAQQWSNDYHDNYHIIEYTFTNTGNVDDDAEVELPNQTLQDVYFVFMDRPKINAPSGSWDNSSGGMAWGQHTMNDAVGDGNEDYGVDFRAQFSWIGFVSGKAFNTLGNPMWYNHQWNSVSDDTLGRLGAATMAGQIVLHADQAAHPAGATSPDDPAQPHTMTYLDSDWSDITTGSDHNNIAKMEFERQWIERGSELSAIAPVGANPRTWPHHAYLIEPDKNFVSTTGDPSLGKAGGWGFVNGYGPYQMNPGDEVKIVVAEGVAGLTDEAAWTIGRRYKLSGANDSLKIAFDANGNGTIEADENMVKNRWVMTARDSLFQMFRRARANYQSGGNVPQPPMPPQTFEVTSGTDQISLAWTTYAGEPDPPNGWEIWRAEKDYNGVITSLKVENGLGVPDSARAYKMIQALPGSARSFTDNTVQRGLSYFYYLQAVGSENTDPTGLTPTGVIFKSNRYYTQTYEPAFLRRSPGPQLSGVRIVPNPYNISSDPEVRFGDKQDKLAFYGLPGTATIKIYTELGELVDTIEHTDGSGDEFWDLTTSSRQLIVSGLYLAVIENKDDSSSEFGQQVIQKFIIVR